MKWFKEIAEFIASQEKMAHDKEGNLLLRVDRLLRSPTFYFINRAKSLGKSQCKAYLICPQKKEITKESIWIVEVTNQSLWILPTELIQTQIVETQNNIRHLLYCFEDELLKFDWFFKKYKDGVKPRSFEGEEANLELCAANLEEYKNLYQNAKKMLYKNLEESKEEKEEKEKYNLALIRATENNFKNNSVINQIFVRACTNNVINNSQKLSNDLEKLQQLELRIQQPENIIDGSSIKNQIRFIEKYEAPFMEKIEHLFNNGQKIATYDKNNLIVSVQRKKESLFYLINLLECLGRGSQGSVYKAYQIHPKTGPVMKHPVAVKIIDKNKFLEAETKIQKRHYKMEDPQYIGEKIYLFSEYLTGKTLSESKNEIAKLTLEQRIKLIIELTTKINLLHHNTLRKGNAVIHGDIKSNNIIVDLDDKDKPRAFLLDFGFSIDDVQDDPNHVNDHFDKVNPTYFAPETINGKFALKTDVYMLVSVITHILGEKHPYKYKDMMHNKYKDKSLTSNEKFSLEWITFKEPLEEFSAKMVTTQFVNLMQENNYKFRPNMDQVLRFFLILDSFYKTCPNDDKSLKACSEKLESILNDVVSQNPAPQATEVTQEKKPQLFTSRLCSLFPAEKNSNPPQKIIPKKNDQEEEDEIFKMDLT